MIVRRVLLAIVLLMVGCENKVMDSISPPDPVTPDPVTLPEPVTPPEPATQPDPVTPPEPVTPPPFAGTVWVSPDIIDVSDASSVQGIEYAGRGERGFYKGYTIGFTTIETYLFNVKYSTGKSVEFQVETAWGSQEAALEQVEIHSTELGRMPLLLIHLVSEMEIGNIGRIAATPQSGEIHVDVEIGRQWIEMGFWQESLFHETVHTSLENAIRWDPDWFAAQEADGTFISDYARFLPDTEDIAETFLLWFAVRYRPKRLPGDVLQKVLNSVPNRLAYFDEQGYDMTPYRLSD